MTTFSLAGLQILATSVGFPDPALAASVAMAESGGHTDAVGDSGTSFGLWQIHTPAHPEYTEAELMDATANARAAYKISSGGTNWKPWSTFNSGAYLAYYSPSQAVVLAPSAVTPAMGRVVIAALAAGVVAYAYETGALERFWGATRRAVGT